MGALKILKLFSDARMLADDKQFELFCIFFGADVDSATHRPFMLTNCNQFMKICRKHLGTFAHNESSSEGLEFLNFSHYSSPFHCELSSTGNFI